MAGCGEAKTSSVSMDEEVSYHSLCESLAGQTVMHDRPTFLLNYGRPVVGNLVEQCVQILAVHERH